MVSDVFEERVVQVLKSGRKGKKMNVLHTFHNQTDACASSRLVSRDVAADTWTTTLQNATSNY